MLLLLIVGVFDLCLFTVVGGRLWLLLCYGIIVFGFASLWVCLLDWCVVFCLVVLGTLFV